MLLDLFEINEKYNLNIQGVLHIGAHIGQEDWIYNRLGIQNKIYFEPIKKNYDKLKDNVTQNSILYNIALGNNESDIEMYVEESNQMMSCSILKPSLHEIQYPHIVFDKKEIVQMKKMDSIEFDRTKYNFINIDVQGFELEVLKGCAETLNHIDYILSEINRDFLYENCVQIGELEFFLSDYGFKLVETNWAGDTWGDGFFIKEKYLL